MKHENIVRARFVDGVMYQEHPDGSLTPLPKGETDWVALNAKTEEQLLADALSDPDALPLTDEQLARFERVEAQSAEYKGSVLPAACRNRGSIEAGVSDPRFRHVGLDRRTRALGRFRIRAPRTTATEEPGAPAPHLLEVG